MQWKRSSRTYRMAAAALWVVLAVLGVLALRMGLETHSPVERLTSGRTTLLNSCWECTVQEENGTAEFRYRIPEDHGDFLWVSLKTYLPDSRLLLNGEEVYAFSSQSAQRERRSHIVELPERAGGKVLTLRTTDVSSVKRDQVGSAILGQKDEIQARLLWDNLYALVFAIFAFLLGTVMLIAALLARKSPNLGVSGGLLNFSVFIFITGIWVVTDSELLLFLTDREAVISLVSFVSFIIMPVFLLRFIDSLMGGKKVFDVLCRLYFVIAALYLLNYLMKAVPGYWLVMPAHLVSVCAIVLVLKFGVEQFRRSRDREILRILEGFGLMSVFIVAALVRFYLDPFSQYSVLYCVGIFFFVLCLMRAGFGRLYEQVEQNANAAAYRRLIYMDVMTDLWNRAAFMKEQEKDVPLSGTSYILIDINGLKSVNDSYGHPEGDRLIVSAANCIRDVFAEAGKCFRIGGDKFVVILRSSSAAETEAGLERLRERVARENSGRAVPLEIAAGYAVWRSGETADQLYHRADANMYAEKQKMKAAAGV